MSVLSHRYFWCCSSSSKTLRSLSIRMLSLNFTFIWMLVLKLLMNPGHLLGSLSNLWTSIGGKLRDSMSFRKITLLLSSVWLSAARTVSLPSIHSSMNTSMATIMGVSHLFPEAKDKHRVCIIVSMSGFEILFESQVNDDCLFWFVVGITVLNFGLVYRKSSMLFWVVVFNGTIGGFELLGTLLDWFALTGLPLL